MYIVLCMYEYESFKIKRDLTKKYNCSCAKSISTAHTHASFSPWTRV